MFTGIIEALGEVKAIEKDQENVIFKIQSPISPELKIDQSLSHNGVCLTVTAIENNLHSVTAIQETLRKSNLGNWEVGTLVNLERSMPANGRFDGHIVQGHVDQTANCIVVKDEAGSWFYTFEYDAKTGNFTVEKGSICINGVSLTVVNAKEGQLSVAIIPYTYENTNFQQIKKDTQVNLEFDIVGKYIQQLHLK
ncbi:MAG: riboflavin synthase, partial [Bacteroidota bacterium]